MGITWGPGGVLQLRDNEDIPVQTAEEVISFPITLTIKVTMSPRSLVIVSVLVNLPPYKNKTRFDFIPLEVSPDLGPNCIIYPLDFATIRGGQQKALQVLMNLGEQELCLSQGILLGHFQQGQLEEIMITTKDIFGVNIEEPWAAEDMEDEVLKGDGKGFITSPADIEPRELIKLRDAKVASQHREAFEALCEEYKDVFSKDSADL